MSTIITLTNQKGGVGKTTTSAAIAAGFVAMGKKVLGIDLDPQGNFGFSLGISPGDFYTLYDVFKKDVSIKDTIKHAEICDIICSDIMLSAVELEFRGSGRESLLKNAIAPIRDDYDFIIIDTPPSLNILTVNAFVVSNHLIIPMASEILSLVGVSQIKDTIDNIRNSFNPDLNVLGILLNKYDKRTLLAQEVAEMAEILAVRLGSHVFKNKIRASVSVAEAPAQGQSILEYAPGSPAGKDYIALMKEISSALYIK